MMNVFAAIVTFAMFSARLYCASKAFSATEVQETVLWSVGALFIMIAAARLKMYLCVNKNAIVLEVKRLELQGRGWLCAML